jgi:uncharacterized protein (DUF488 family)
MRTLFTIGHSRHPIGHFIELLGRHGVRTLADVRSRPYSKWAPQFQQSPLAGALEAAGILYAFLGRELGGRPGGAEYYEPDGRVDYRRRAGAPDFLAGIARLEALADAGPTAILCAEEDPGRCHRKLLIAPVLGERGTRVVHIRGDGRLEDDEAQASLFGG